ncbi:MAG: DUF559 domain-containing protein [Prevotella sp.]|nr:DUF559 domain-containing protein [Prevotella sp.]
MYKTAEANPKSQKDLRQALRNNLTPAEATLWKALKAAQINGLKFRRQHGIGPYVMDFYCPSIKLCIELDGEVHNMHGAYLHDSERTRFLNENGVTVMRFENEIVFKNINAIIESIVAYEEEWKRNSRICK